MEAEAAQPEHRPMTEAERKMLREAHDGIMELRAALLEKAPGSPSDEKPLLEDIRIVIRAYKRASWATRAVIWALPTAALIGASLKSLVSYFTGGR